MLAWHFTDVDCRLRYGDGRIVTAGETITVDCEPRLCMSGLHASENILFALERSPGPYVWRVDLGGLIVRGRDECVGTARTALWGFNATDVLLRFARYCALDVAHLWDIPDVVLRFLKTGDESLRDAARGAVRDTACGSAWVAARGAVRDTAWGSAWVAARDAARGAVRDTAWDAARDAARDAAWSAARDAARGAVRDTAWSAAWGSARETQSRRLTSMVCAEHRKLQRLQ